MKIGSLFAVLFLFGEVVRHQLPPPNIPMEDTDQENIFIQPLWYKPSLDLRLFKIFNKLINDDEGKK